MPSFFAQIRHAPMSQEDEREIEINIPSINVPRPESPSSFRVGMPGGLMIIMRLDTVGLSYDHSSGALQITGVSPTQAQQLIDELADVQGRTDVQNSNRQYTRHFRRTI